MSESIQNRSPEHGATRIELRKINYVYSVRSRRLMKIARGLFVSLSCPQNSRCLSGARKYLYMLIIEMEVIRINNNNAATSREAERWRSPVCISA